MTRLPWVVAPVLAAMFGCATHAPDAMTARPTVEHPTPTETASEPASTATSAERPFRTGSIGVLRSGGGYVLAGTSEAALDRLTQLCNAKDSYGLAQMMLAGQALGIKDGTRARLIDPGIITHEVRVLEGEYRGRSAFISAEFLVSR